MRATFRAQLEVLFSQFGQFLRQLKILTEYKSSVGLFEGDVCMCQPSTSC